MRVRLEEVDLGAQAIGERQVVLVQPCDVLPACLVEDPIAHSHEPEVPLVLQQADAAVGEGPDHAHAVVGGAVVDEEELPVLVGLLKDAGDRLRDVPLAAVHRDPYGDQRLSA